MGCVRINIKVWIKFTEKKNLQHYRWRNRFSRNFYILLLRPKTVLLLKEFIVKYSPFIPGIQQAGQMVKMNRKTTQHPRCI